MARTETYDRMQGWEARLYRDDGTAVSAWAPTEAAAEKKAREVLD